MKKLSVVVPYRDREEHLKQFVPYMEKWLKEEEIPFEIIIVNQTNGKGFNRAKLLNVGFKETEECDYHVFHDVDMLPTDSDYDYTDGPTILLHKPNNLDINCHMMVTLVVLQFLISQVL